MFSAIVAADAGTQSDPGTFIRDDDADIQSKPNPIAEEGEDDVSERKRKIIAEYESTRKGTYFIVDT